MSYDPKQKLHVEVDLESPQDIAFWLWYKEPGDSKYTQVAGGDHDNSETSSSHTYDFGPFPSGTLFHYYFNITGNPSTAYKADIRLTQGGNSVASIPTINGTTNNVGTASADGEVTLK